MCGWIISKFSIELSRQNLICCYYYCGEKMQHTQNAYDSIVICFICEHFIFNLSSAIHFRLRSIEHNATYNDMRMIYSACIRFVHIICNGNERFERDMSADTRHTPHTCRTEQSHTCLENVVLCSIERV